MITNGFTIKSYGWQELAILYSPDINPRSAVKKLSRWVNNHPELKKDLQQNGWKKGAKVLTPEQVDILIYYLGVPTQMKQIPKQLFRSF